MVERQTQRLRHFDRTPIGVYLLELLHPHVVGVGAVALCFPPPPLAQPARGRSFHPQQSRQAGLSDFGLGLQDLPGLHIEWIRLAGSICCSSLEAPGRGPEGGISHPLVATHFSPPYISWRAGELSGKEFRSFFGQFPDRPIYISISIPVGARG